MIVLDDDATLLHDVMQAARRWFDVSPLRDPALALRCLREDPSIQVILMGDLFCLRDRIGFLESVRLVREDVYRVLLTNYQDVAQVICGLHSGAAQFALQKPINTDELLSALARFCAASSGTASARKAAG
jgi:ActR/RegA family two-component response regulator